MDNSLAGQWLAELPSEEDPSVIASVRLDLENRGHSYHGHAYLFYSGMPAPGFVWPLVLPAGPPFSAEVRVIYLYPQGGRMTESERVAAKEMLGREGSPPPDRMKVELSLKGNHLLLKWNDGGDFVGEVELDRAEAGKSELEPLSDIKSWDDFRQWAVKQRPRHYIFRGQRQSSKLMTTFHRTWRKDLNTWTKQDTRALFGAVADSLNYPLQIGNLDHNAALWSILQHHGYPTPMLDWSYSPFVAAFFAFQHAAGTGEKPRIYILDSVAWGRNYGRDALIVDEAPNQLVLIESMPVANPRHAPQQAVSTVTNMADVERFIQQREEADGQSYLSVCDFDPDCRDEVLSELEIMGITYGSLFPGLDGICRDMKDRLFARPPRIAEESGLSEVADRALPSPGAQAMEE